jgi:catechol-2,3-dioxygenase
VSLYSATMTDGVPTQLGHVALRVRDLERSVQFYRDVMGLKLRSQHETVAFLGIRPDASHEVALFQIGADAPGPEQDRVGMYHMAWEMPSFEALEAFHQRLKTNGVQITGYSPRQMNVMFLDPDGNVLEAIWEPPHDELERLKAAGLPRLQT